MIEEEQSNFVIAHAEDFIGEFVGQTGPKTEAFIKKNTGKVIFIDECYTLMQEYYGIEALTVITRYISENINPRNNIFIFAGYDDLVGNLYKLQPGLKRRCKFRLKITKYEYKELGEIFKTQIRKTDMELGEESDKYLDTFFESRMKDFPSFGGSTMNMIYDLEIALGEWAFGNDSTDKTITPSIIDEAYKNYVEEHKEEDEISKLMMYQ